MGYTRPMSVSFAIWLAVCATKFAGLVATWRPRFDRGLLFLRWYLVFALGEDLAIHFTLNRFGYRSAEYKYMYYGCDLALVVFGFFVLARLVELAFERSTLQLPRLRTGAIVLFTGLASCSAALVYLMHRGLTTAHLGREMEQNFSFLGMLLAIVLFGGLNLMHVRGVRFRRLVLSFSLMYGSGAIVYSLTALASPLNAVAYYAVPLTGLAGMGLIAYSLWVPEAVPEMAEAEATSRLGSVRGVA